MLSDNYFKNGFTFTSWIWVDKIEDQDVQVILDSRGPYQSIDDNDDNLFNHLVIYLRKGIPWLPL